MLEAYSTNLTVANGTNITFATKNIQTGTTAVLGDDNATISLNKAGIYRVDFNAFGGSTSDGEIGAQLFANNSAVTRAATQATTSAGDVANISFSSLVTVTPAIAGNTAKLTVQYQGGAGTLNLANLIVTKIA